MRRALLWLNVAIALVTLASASGVLAQDLLVPGYRAHYRDAVWFVALYCAVQGMMLVEFARDGRLVPWLALAKTVAAYLFLINFTALWPRWAAWTPARYVYQLFHFDLTQIGLLAMVFLGRGAFNTVNALYFTEHWWQPFRDRQPLLGRLVTTIPVAAAVLCVWGFVLLIREEVRTFSAEAQEVARAVYASLDCEAVRANEGKTTTDLRRRGERHFHVEISYGCAETRVVVRGEDGRMGGAAGGREECCGGG